ncbi:hypothetical protein APHWI1_0372 [Anaplasma phagocytophilum str. ApWI1]|uniref:Uncharacterized protein n=3 Tax=Anaplasma phagocytophilum TaxID=948 RepID=Q2GJK9_ANAPZ|nr:hypothetical protein APH_0866 [Anaplasma phagocytophilum str. HZ]AGR80774.1 hypothetical protein WSQ_03995 [Anaplasma phagocytophilum str. JM]AGR82026.1 hypothetical protein YYY_03985 [Anaplasma phagocytophilum str. Dog2]KJV59759.1 hypothetical protein APHWEB_1144 [Anaplasma phagocytophilum str. Webster]KJV63168.1 hypothetical protein EPHNCH_1191 [Anaplasma phagocytophilum str. NCH-1]KJV82704.1 hypothetical protein APHHGE2_1168 [Anaplasma phagocytophilum str. HGE2]KJV84549.1 hypothetical p
MIEKHNALEVLQYYTFTYCKAEAYIASFPAVEFVKYFCDRKI